MHCRYLTEALAQHGVDVTFFMPPTNCAIDAPWMKCVKVSSVSSMTLGEFLKFNSYSMASALKYTVSGGKIAFSMVLDKAYGKEFFEAVNTYNTAAAAAVVEEHAKEPFNVIHCHDWITTSAGLLAKRATNLPLVITMHSSEFDRSACLNPTPWILELEKMGVRNADAIIAVSGIMREQLAAELGLDKRKTHVVYNATPLMLPPAPKRETRFWWKHVVLCHGRLSIQKGADYFLRAVRKVASHRPDALFVVSGTGAFLPALVELATALGVEDRVMFLGNVPQEKLSTLYNCCDVFVLPSVREPFGITALEAMHFGKPVVISKTAGACEMGDGMFPVDFWDVDKLAHTVTMLLDDEQLRAKAGEAARRTAAGQKWFDRGGDTKAVYEQVLRENGENAIPSSIEVSS